jgi:hypothetical protein
MAILSKKEILTADDLARELVPVPEWGGEVYVRGMTGAERDKFESGIVEQRGKSQSLNMANIRAKLASLTICDETGQRLFTEADVQALSAKSAAALQRVFEVGQRLSRIGADDVKELAGEVTANPTADLPTA